jgi:hypothetical protein
VTEDRFGCIGGLVADHVPVLHRVIRARVAATDRCHGRLGRSSYVLTLTTYADFIPDVETENPLSEPVALANVDTGNVLNLHRSTAG